MRMIKDVEFIQTRFERRIDEFHDVFFIQWPVFQMGVTVNKVVIIEIFNFHCQCAILFYAFL